LVNCKPKSDHDLGVSTEENEMAGPESEQCGAMLREPASEKGEKKGAH
jgi:hypothetical protein